MQLIDFVGIYHQTRNADFSLQIVAVDISLAFQRAPKNSGEPFEKEDMLKQSVPISRAHRLYLCARSIL